MRKIYVLLYSILILLGLGTCAWQGVNQYPLGEVYPRQNELVSRLNAISNSHPNCMKHRIIGFSGTEQLPIHVVEIGSGTRNILIIGQHHGDEILGVALAERIIQNLCAKSGKRYSDLKAKYKFWIIPSLNPEAWRIVSSGITQFKRKNNRDTDGNKKLDLRTDGVDLNRNYPVFWDLDPDINILSPYYKGTSPASEPEIQAVIALARKVDFSLAVFYHSSASGAFSEKIYLPAVQEPNPKFLWLSELAELYAKSVPRDYYKGTYTLHTGPTSRVGNARNFFFHSLNVPAMLIEIGGINRDGRSVIHPPEKIVEKILERNERALFKVLNEERLWTF